MAAKDIQENNQRESIQNVLPTAPPELAPNRTYGEILGDVGESLKDIVQSDLSLMLSELKQIQRNLGAEAKKIVVFGTILSVSFTPLVAAAVIGLGIAMNGRYWLSSLIVGIILAGVGSVGFFSAYKRFKKIDVDLPKTKSALKEEGEIIYRELNKVKVAIKGEGYELH